MSGPIRYPLSSVWLTELERGYAHQAVDTHWISGTGQFLALFEAEVCRRSERAFAVAVNSGTSALSAALAALGVGPGDEVVVPALTFAAPASAVRSAGALPVFADIEPRTWTIDPEQVSRVATSRTKAVIAVDVFGHLCDYAALAELDLPVIEDAAEAHGAEYQGRPAGAFGRLAVFSFHANKTVTTGEGGCVVTDDTELAERARLAANHGMTAARPYWHEMVGHNFRMTNVTAAIGYGQMQRWDELIAARRRVAELYDEALAGLPLERRPVGPGVRECCWLYTVGTDRRDDVVARLRARGVDARAVWPAVSDLPLFASSVRADCPVARAVSGRALWLPTYAQLSPDDITEIAACCRQALSGG